MSSSPSRSSPSRTRRKAGNNSLAITKSTSTVMSRTSQASSVRRMAALRGLSTRKMKQKALSGAGFRDDSPTFTKSFTFEEEENSSNDEESVSSFEKELDNNESYASAESTTSSHYIADEQLLPVVEEIIARKIQTPEETPNTDKLTSEEYEDSTVDKFDVDAHRQRVKRKMVQSPSQLDGLLTAALTPGSQGLNAAGALKVLTDKRNSRVTLAWTRGVLSALVSIIETQIRNKNNNIATSEDKSLKIKEASQRALIALKNLLDPYENRIMMFYTPGVLDCLLYFLVEHKDGDFRIAASRCLLYFSEIEELHLSLANNKSLFTAIRKAWGTTDWNNNEKSAGFVLVDFIKALATNSKCAYLISKDTNFIKVLVSNIETLDKETSVARLLELIALLTKNWRNLKSLCCTTGIVDCLVKNYHQSLFAIYSLLNLSSEPDNRLHIVKSVQFFHCVTLILDEKRDRDDYESRLASLKLLRNLSREPASILYFMKSEGVLNVLQKLARAECIERNNVEEEMIIFLACDILASLSAWIYELSTPYLTVPK